DPTYAADYQAYLAAYSTWLLNNFTSNTIYTNGTPPAPSAPLYSTQYGNYATAWFNYWASLPYDPIFFTYTLYAFAPAAPGLIAATNSGPTPPEATANLPSNMGRAADPLPVQFAALMAGQSAS